jgi:serine/threonine protein kinase
MAKITAEKLAQRAFNVNLLSSVELESVWGELGSRDATGEDLQNYFLRKEMLTNFQIDRLIKGEIRGYFYGKYKVLYIVGAGTFARVYRAVHTETGRVVAVKVLRKRFRDDPNARAQFLMEGQTLLSLRHPNIVPIYEVDDDRHSPYMIMEFVEGQNLREFVKIRKTFDPVTTAKISLDLFKALDYAAKKGITHRDLKLSNVLVTGHGTAKLVDFGLAAVGASTDDLAMNECDNPRTVDYAGLEKGTNAPKGDPRSDIYFAGCIMYHMLTGEAPLYETRDRIKRMSVSRFQEVEPLMKLAPNVPRHLAIVVNRCMELNPQHRFQTPGDAVHELEQILPRLSDDVDQIERDSNAENPQKEGIGKTVMLVTKNEKLQNTLRERLKHAGYRTLVTSELERPKTLVEDSGEKAIDCVIFCTSSDNDKTVEMFNFFGQKKFTRNIACLFFVGEDEAAIVEKAHLAKHRKIIRLPLKFRELRAGLREVILHADRLKNADS